MDRLRVALIGPGFIAQRHLEVLSREPGWSWSGSWGARPGQGGRGGPALRWTAVPRARRAARRRAPGGRLDLPAAGPAWRPRGGADRPRHPPHDREAARRRPRDAEHDRGGDPGEGAGRGRRLPLAGDGHAARGRRGHRRAAGPAAHGHWHDGLPGPRGGATRRGGGQMVEQATHLVDLSRRLLGEATVVAATRTATTTRTTRRWTCPTPHRHPPLRRRAGRRDHRDLHPRRDQRPGGPAVLRRAGDHDPPAGCPVRGLADQGRHGDRRVHRQPPVGRDRDPLRPDGQRPVPGRGPGVRRRRPDGDALPAVQPLRRRVADAPADVSIRDAGGGSAS